MKNTFFIGVTILLLVIVVHFSFALNLLTKNEKRALGDLADALHYPWNWGLSEPNCDWLGVICNDYGHVVNLALSRGQLSGSIPESIGGLYKLESFGIGVNNIQGPLPSSLANITTLQFLLMDLNPLDATIPNAWSQFQSIRMINIASARLYGSIPPNLVKIPSLDTLILNSNNLQGKVPPVPKKKEFISLDFRNNTLSGSLPNDLSGVDIFNLSNNNLTGTIPQYICQLAMAPHTTEIWLQNNQWTCPLPDCCTSPLLNNIKCGGQCGYEKQQTEKRKPKIQIN
mmetsp:Transcript_15613/g.23410  ORF Transcript_15613/g.23410 Transcript_15613/m.23410 type:complete len:285 (+) Transcript_15613:2-856(+)